MIKNLTTRQRVFFSLFALGLTGLATHSLIATDLVDTFTRTASLTMGSSEKMVDARWFEAGENMETARVSLSGNVLSLDSETGTNPSLGYVAANVGRYASADVDITVDLKGDASDTFGTNYGISYRLASLTDAYPDPGGYYVRVNRVADEVSLYYGNTALSTVSVSIPDNDFTEVRVVASGTSHTVYVDSIQQISLTDSSKTNAGYVGLYVSSSKATFDNFQLKEDGLDASLSDDFNRSNNNYVGPLTSSGWVWSETLDVAADDLLTIENHTARLRYFNASTSQPNLSMNIEDYTAADLDVRASIRPFNDNYGGYYGIGYRLASQDSQYQAANGYYVRLNRYADPDTVSLYFGNTLIDSANVTIPDPGYGHLRVVAQGERHIVYLDQGAITDDFDRSDSDTAGILSDAIGHAWQENGDGENDGLIQLLNSRLDFHYFRNVMTASPALSANIEDFTASDLDITVDIEPATDYDHYYGIGYRLANETKRFQEADGYYVQLDRTIGTVTLWFGNTQVATESVTIPSGSVTVRVVVDGHYHYVYVDNMTTPALHVLDYSKLSPGHCGVFTYYSIAKFDNFTVNDRNPRPVLDITHAGKTTAGYTGLFVYYSIMYCDEFSVGRMPSFYPNGPAFPVSFFSTVSFEDIQQTRPFGMYLGRHPVTLYNAYIPTNEIAGTAVIAQLPCEGEGGTRSPLTQSELSEFMDAYTDNPYIAQWFLPEELRPAEPTEEDILENYRTWAYQNDPYDRPVNTYFSHIYAPDTDALEDYLDIITISLYRYMISMPPAWMRWQAEESVGNLVGAGVTIGEDFANDEMVVYGGLELTELNQNLFSFEGAYHDFWQGVCSGLRGFHIYNNFYKASSDACWSLWDGYCKGSSELTGPEGVGTAVLEGTVDSTIDFTITSGPDFVDSYTPSLPAHLAVGEITDQPSLNLLAVKYSGQTYIITVNSADESVTATVDDLPSGVGTADVLFEGRTESISSQSFTDTWEPLEVHIYRIDGVN